MRQSRLLNRTLRELPADAEAASHRLMLRAGLIRQLSAGVYSYLPLGLRALRHLENIVRDEMERAGAQAILLPALHPAELWRDSGRWDVYGPELMRLTDRHGREFALGATHEEVITSLLAGEVNSYKKLPVTVYQIQTKFRDELRPRFGLLRGREFVMKDAYSFDTSREGLQASYGAMYDAYHRIFTRCGLNFRAIEADSGAMGGTGTHEFVAIASIGEDTVLHCLACKYAANEELLAGQEPLEDGVRLCPRCSQPLDIAKGIEVAHVFQLGTRYSEKLGATFVNENGELSPMIMGCYGIGISRTLAALIEQNHDEHGMIWPDEIAPYLLHLLTVQSADPIQQELSEYVYRSLQESGTTVLWDDRGERPGVKLADADLLGLPIQIRIGRKAAERIVECKHRRTGTVTEIHIDSIASYLKEHLSQGGQPHVRSHP